MRKKELSKFGERAKSVADNVLSDYKSEIESAIKPAEVILRTRSRNLESNSQNLQEDKAECVER